MKVTIDIPVGILQTCLECGWNEEQTRKVFNKYLQEISRHMYNQFEADFDNWISNEDNEEFLDNL